MIKNSMIMQPVLVTDDIVEEAKKHKKKDLMALSKVRSESFTEGRSEQTLHIGPFSEEGPTMQKIMISFTKKDRNWVENTMKYISLIPERLILQNGKRLSGNLSKSKTNGKS